MLEENIIYKPSLVVLKSALSDGTSLNKRSCFPTGFLELFIRKLVGVQFFPGRLKIKQTTT